MKRRTAFLAAAVMIAGLSACGKIPGEIKKNISAGADSAAEDMKNEENAEAAEGKSKKATWSNAIGQSGSVEYEYDEKGELVKTILYHGDTQRIYRILEREIISNDQLYAETITYAAGGVPLYRQDTFYYINEGESEQKLDIKAYEMGWDLIAEGTSSDIRYTGSGFREKSSLYETYKGAMDWRITNYGENGMPVSESIYYKDGYLMEVWNYEEKDGKMYLIPEIGRGQYSIEYDEQGRIIRLAGKKEYDVVEMVYDEKGNMTGRTRTEGGEEIYTQTYTYREDGTLAHSTYTCIPGMTDTGNFDFDENESLIRADYSFLNGSIGGDDKNLFEIEYYDDGGLKCWTGYQSSSYKEKEKKEVRQYDENGTEISKEEFD
ncbi:MAG: hypothetical protein KH828_12465 [Clostridiales bacterium]|nr:hypothetical protein [Clostridiales bacterium]